MKFFISLLLLVSVVVSGMASYHLFRDFDYNISAVLTITSYLSIVMTIYALTVTDKKKTAAISK